MKGKPEISTPESLSSHLEKILKIKNDEDVEEDEGHEDGGSAASSSSSEEEGEREEEEDEEGCIQSVTVDGDECSKESSSGVEDDEIQYTSKGPVFRQQNKTNGGASPYAKPNQQQQQQQQQQPLLQQEQQQLNLYDVDLTILDNIGSLLDDIDPKLILDQLPSPPEGIPELPQPKVGVNQILMNSIDDVFGKQGTGSRIIFKTESDENSPFSIVPIPMSFVVDIDNKRIGIQIPRQIIPRNVLPPTTSESSVPIFIQLDPHLRRVIKYTALVEKVVDKTGQTVNVIKSQFMTLKPLKEKTGLTLLMDGISEAEIDNAMKIVNSKDITELFKTYGPNNDTLLSLLCFSKDESTTLRAKVLALTKKILGHPEAEYRANIIKKNKCDVSALEFAATTNKAHIAPYMAELYYDIGEDYHCTDSEGNTLLHLMARKGDVVAPTLKALLELTFNDGRKVYPSDVKNTKEQMPIHIAAMSRGKCPQNTIQLLYQDCPTTSMRAKTWNGSVALHMACQFASDPTLIASLLYYDSFVVNDRRNDGLTPLHLVASRSDLSDISGGIIPLDEETQVRMIRLLLEHGADKTLFVESMGSRLAPFHLVVSNRTKVKLLLKLRRGGENSPSCGNGSASGSPTSDSPVDLLNAGTNASVVSSGFGSQGSPYQASLMSPTYPAFPQSNHSSTDLDGYMTTSTNSPLQQQQQQQMIKQEQNSTTYTFSPSSSADSGGSDEEAGGAAAAAAAAVDDDGSLDAIAEVLYQHPSIQAAVMMAADSQ